MRIYLQYAVPHMVNIFGQNVNFVCGLLDESKSFDVQINARRIKFVKTCIDVIIITHSRYSIQIVRVVWQKRT